MKENFSYQMEQGRIVVLDVVHIASKLPMQRVVYQCTYVNVVLVEKNAYYCSINNRINKEEFCNKIRIMCELDNFFGRLQ